MKQLIGAVGFVGLCASFTNEVALALAPSKAWAFAAIGVGSIGSVAFPAISSIKANNVRDSEQVCPSICPLPPHPTQAALPMVAFAAIKSTCVLSFDLSDQSASNRMLRAAMPFKDLLG